jgi:serine/threonine protein kinase
VRKKDSKEVFAMKIMEKEEIIARGKVAQILNELKFYKHSNAYVEKKIFPMNLVDLFSQNNNKTSPKNGQEDSFKKFLHVPILHFAFHDLKNLYIVTEFLPGADLLNVLMKFEVLNEDQCRFYIAEIALAINFVHQLGYIHRDM